MNQPRIRAAVSPPRRRLGAAPVVLPSIAATIAAERPEIPVHCLRPAVFEAAARDFVAGFPGDVLYAVKCNPEPAVLRALWRGGVRHFDCASAAEVALVRTMFADAVIHFMHPVKSPAAIREAFARHGVRDFVLDSAAELRKILGATDAAGDLGLVVRLALPKGGAVYDLSGKFGVPVAEAAALLRAARPHAARLGIAFHVGSQCLDPGAYARALALVGEAIGMAGVAVDIVDVGGGFPAAYEGVTPPPRGEFFAAIATGFAALGLPAGTQLWAEPGRALVADGGSVVVRVELVREAMLHVNDGVYGALSDLRVPGFLFPCRLIRPDGPVPSEVRREFGFFGPTCDSADVMGGPFLLPADVREGDWIEIGQLGAYGACLRTPFNGFDRALLVDVRDAPLLSTTTAGRVPAAA